MRQLKDGKFIKTIYDEEDDVTLLVENSFKEGKRSGYRILGFYFGQPNEDATKNYSNPEKIKEENETFDPYKVEFDERTSSIFGNFYLED